MDPFKITCVTCQARLSVRSEGLIGQIIACPKCGSMVQVTAPTRGASTAAGALGAAGTSSIVVGAAHAIEARSATPPQSPTFDDATDFGADLPAPPQSAQVPPATVPVKARVRSASPTLAGFGAAKITAIVVASALAGSALVVGLLAMRGNDSAAPVAGSAGTAPASLPQDGVARTPDAASAIDPPPVDAARGAESVVQRDPAPPVENAIENAPAESAGDAGAPVAVANNVPPAPPNIEPPAPADADARPAADATAPRLRIDPLDLDPEGMDIATLLHGPSVDTLAGAGAEDPAPRPDKSAAGPSDAVPNAPARAGREAVERVEPANPPAAPKVLLARRIAAVKVDGMPLARFLDFATTLSAMPVSVTPDELRLAAVSASTAVSVDAKDVTIEQLLTAALKPLRLSPTLDGGQILLRRTVGDQRRELTYPVGDLVAGDAQQLAGWVQALVEPDSWQKAGGAGTLTVDGTSLRLNQSERTGYAAILFLERYRSVLGLAPQSKYPAALLAAWSGTAKLQAPMAAPATFTFSRPAPLGEIFRWWAGELNVAVLVDWPALDAQRIWPHTRVPASANQKPWGEAMTAALEPLGLGWRAVDSRTIEITSLEKIRTEPVVELYRLADGANTSAAELLKQVAALSAEGAKPADAVAATATFFDDAHRVLMVRQPAAVQRRVGEWLARAGLLAATRG